MEGEKTVWKCSSCKKDLVLTKVKLTYMGREFNHEVPACPQCGRVYISKELARGKMADAEMLMEDK